MAHVRKGAMSSCAEAPLKQLMSTTAMALIFLRS